MRKKKHLYCKKGRITTVRENQQGFSKKAALKNRQDLTAREEGRVHSKGCTWNKLQKLCSEQV